ncbi:MAG: hypothetical protein ABI184_06900 [Ginsengibacter sp.]
MKDSKTLFLMILALVLVTSSFVLISIWGYRYYFQQKNDLPVSKSKGKKQQETAEKLHYDSLQNFTDSSVGYLDSPSQNQGLNNSDSLSKTLQIKLIEYKKIQEEIAEILKNKAVLKNRVDETKRISELQKNIDSLNKKKEEMILENEKMNQMLTQKVQLRSAVTQSDNFKNATTVQPTALPLLVSHLKFEAINDKGDYEKQTMLASQASKFEGSFEININPKMNNASEIFVKILQPNGRPILNASSGFSILEADAGKSSYSLVLHFDKNKDNHARLKFSIATDVFHKGRYTMQIYHNGVMIGRMQRTLM